MSTSGRHLRVLMTADTVGGVFQYAVELASALADRGAVTILATMCAPASDGQRAAALAVPGLELRETGFRLEWMPEPWSDVDQAGEWLRALEDETSPDVVHLNGFAHAALRWRAPTVVVAHSCVLSWFEAVRGCRAPSTYDEYRRRVGRGLRAASCVIAPSAAMAHAVDAHHGPGLTCRVIYNGRSPNAYGTARKEPFVFAMGRLWDDAKNIASLAAVAPSLPWAVRVAGSSHLEDRDVGALRGLERLGVLSGAEVRDHLSRAAIYALPARYEPFGLSVLEAALSSCALVLGDIASLRELWDGCAIFVDPADQRALGDALNGLTADEDRRALLGSRARDRALRYSRDRMVNEYLGTYRELLQRRACQSTSQGAQCA